jgi:hypothetical protein
MREFNLPLDILQRVFQYLYFGDLLILRKVNTRFQKILSLAQFWKYSICGVEDERFITSAYHTDKYSLQVTPNSCLMLKDALAMARILKGFPIKYPSTCNKQFLDYFGNLVDVNLAGLLICDKELEILVKGNSKIRSLTLSRCQRLTELSLILISKYLQELVFLDVSKSFIMTTRGWIELSCSHLNIEIIKMACCMACIDWSIASLMFPKSLRVWDISDNMGITKEGLQDIAETRQSQSTKSSLLIDVRNCELLTSEDISFLVERYDIKFLSNPRLRNNREDGIREYLEQLISV